MARHAAWLDRKKVGTDNLTGCSAKQSANLGSGLWIGKATIGQHFWRHHGPNARLRGVGNRKCCSKNLGDLIFLRFYRLASTPPSSLSLVYTTTRILTPTKTSAHCSRLRNMSSHLSTRSPSFSMNHLKTMSLSYPQKQRLAYPRTGLTLAPTFPPLIAFLLSFLRFSSPRRFVQLPIKINSYAYERDFLHIRPFLR